LSLFGKLFFSYALSLTMFLHSVSYKRRSKRGPTVEGHRLYRRSWKEAKPKKQDCSEVIFCALQDRMANQRLCTMISWPWQNRESVQLSSASDEYKPKQQQQHQWVTTPATPSLLMPMPESKPVGPAGEGASSWFQRFL